MVSLSWGGKREWATWRVRANVAQASERGFDTMFGRIDVVVSGGQPGGRWDV
jgi:hypothetical protein